MKKIITSLLLILFFSLTLNAQYGYNWITKASGTQNNLNQAYLYNSNTGFICGANGTFLVSTNGYGTWVSKSPGINISLQSLCSARPYINGTSVICCGENGVLLHTSNNGNNWTQLTSNTTAKLNCIINCDSSVYAVGNNGTIIKSNWSGSAYLPFSVLNSGTTQNLKSIYYYYNNNTTCLYACGSNGTILKSSNSGANWFALPFSSSQNLNSISINYQMICVCGDNGSFYFSTNEGLNWTYYSLGSSNLNFLSGYNYITGNSGTLYYNVFNFGSQFKWNKIPLPTSENLNFTSCYDNYFAFGSNGTILKRETDTAKLISFINANNIRTCQSYTGIFDRDITIGNNPGFEWPVGSGKHMVFTSGLSATCLINEQIAQIACSYTGEYFPSAITNGQFNDSSIFKIYKVSRTENPPGSDWLNWGAMVPYGAPYTDVNHNGIYEPLIDTPGVKNASQTIFACYTDYNLSLHNANEGFGGGVTSPLMGAELHMTKWEYNYPSFNDVVFTKFEIINKSGSTWNKTRFSIVSDPDVGDPNDDYVGCDTVRNMSFAYNITNNDQIYGAAPPAVGYDILKGPVNKRVSPNVTYYMTSFTRFFGDGSFYLNECVPSNPLQAFYVMKGLKKEGAVWLDPTKPNSPGHYSISKKIFYGDPETNEGWTAPKGHISNTILDTSGEYYNYEIPNDKRMTMSTGDDNYTMNNGDTAVIWLAQLVARGTSNLNSVTKLKQLSDIVQNFFESNFTIGINKISSEIPDRYSLGQNYPNPFNPSTRIKYSLSKNSDVNLVIFDALGRKVAELVNEKQSAGTYEYLFDVSSERFKSLASGVYFYRLTANGFSDVKRMLLIK